MTWVWIIGANLAAFVWGMRQWQLRDREQAREKFLVLVREWDEGQRDQSYAIAGITYTPVRYGFWLRCEATWIGPGGDLHHGRATL